MGKRESNKEEKRRRLLEEGARLFVAHGYDSASIEQVIAAVGIARGTFYLYFPDKKELFTAIIAGIYQPLIVVLEETLEDMQRDVSTEGQQIRYIRTAIELAGILEGQKDLLPLHFREAWSSNAAGDALRVWRHRIELQAKGLVIEAQRLGLFRGVDPQLFVLAVMGSIERVVWAWIQEETSLSRREMAQQLADIFWKGVQNPKD